MMSSERPHFVDEIDSLTEKTRLLPEGSHERESLKEVLLQLNAIQAGGAPASAAERLASLAHR